MDKKFKTGILLALSTALISGFAIFFSKEAISAIGDSFIYTGLKNFVVVFFLIGVLLLFKEFRKLKKLKRKDWFRLILIGAVGGSLPFLLFFKGLTLTTAISGAFIHKTLFIAVAVLAIFYLGEKFSKWQIGALGVLFVGNFLLGGFNKFSWGAGEWMILAATLLWSVEYIIAKRALKNIGSRTVAFSRMFFGSLILAPFVFLSSKSGIMFALTWDQIAIVAIMSLFLLGYVLTWYGALKRLPASVVTCILVLGSVITTTISMVKTGEFVALPKFIGIILIIASIIGFVYFVRHKEKAKFAIPTNKHA